MVSWTRALVGLFGGWFDGADLEGAVYYFGCSREHAFSPGSRGETNELERIAEDDPERGRRVHAALMAEVEKAEAAGRVAWHDGFGFTTYERLNVLLASIGLPTFDDPVATGIIVLPHITGVVQYGHLPYWLAGMRRDRPGAESAPG